VHVWRIEGLIDAVAHPIFLWGRAPPVPALRAGARPAGVRRLHLTNQDYKCRGDGRAVSADRRPNGVGLARPPRGRAIFCEFREPVPIESAFQMLAQIRSGFDGLEAAVIREIDVTLAN